MFAIELIYFSASSSARRALCTASAKQGSTRKCFPVGMVLCGMLTALKSFYFMLSKKQVNVYLSLGIKRSTMVTNRLVSCVISLFVAVFVPIFMVYITNIVNFGISAHLTKLFLYFNMKIEKEYVLREIAGDHIIIPVGTTVLEFNGLITVNEVGVFLWKMLQEEVTMEELVQAVLKEYDVEEEVAREDIQEFLDKLVEGGILS